MNRETMNRETAAASRPARLTPTKGEALRSTTLSRTWEPDLRSVLAKQFGPPPPLPGWRIPQAWRPRHRLFPGTGYPPGPAIATLSGERGSPAIARLPARTDHKTPNAGPTTQAKPPRDREHN